MNSTKYKCMEIDELRGILSELRGKRKESETLEFKEGKDFTPPKGIFGN